MSTISSMPQRIALVFGVPTSVGEFEARRKSPVVWDYGDKLGVSRDDPLKSYDGSCRDDADVASDLIARASAMQMTVVRAARIDQLRAVFESHDVVVLIAHWRGSGIGQSDLESGWQERVHALLEDATAPVGIVLRESGEGSALLEPTQLLRTLNLAIQRQHFRRFFPAGLDERVCMHRLVMEALSRDMVDAAFASYIHRGNLLELFSGLHPPADVLATIPPDFSGVLDLSCCTASVLAAMLRFELGDSMSIVASDEFLVPAPQMRLIECVLNLLSSAPHLSYLEARLQCAFAMSDMRHRRQIRETH